MESEVKSLESQEYFINMGPQHPSTHGVLRLLLTLDGEIIRKVEPHLGYIHRSIEKMCEKDAYQQIVHLTDRMDYLSCHMNNEAVCLGVEKGLEVDINDRIKTIRTIISELNRLSSHTLWWGVMGMDLGAITSFLYGFRDREMITDIFEETCGARLTMNYNVPGGLMFDIPKNFQKMVKDFIVHFRKKIPEYDALLTNNVIFKERTIGIGKLSKEDAISFGATGPTGRASGFACDIRKLEPYSAYGKVEFEEILREEGDCYARYQVRIDEMWEAMKIIEQLIDNIPEGDYKEPTRAVIKLPAGEYYQKVETARGEFGMYIISDGKKCPYRLKFRSPGFSNLSALNHMAKDCKIADLIAILSTIDLVIPDIDR